MITSNGNTRVKEVCALIKKPKERREQGLFVVEGIKMFTELPKSHLQQVFISERFFNEMKKEKKDAEAFLGGCHGELVSDDVMKYMSDTQTPQGILAVARQFSHSLEEILKTGNNSLKDGCSPAHILILETLQDPGNLGTILRAGEGAGLTGVIMNTSTADIYNPKVIRSTMGSVYRVPFVYVEDLESAVREVKKAGIRLFAAHLQGENNYEEESYREGTGFLIGNEANGLSSTTASLADCYVKIPMAGAVESLNAAVAASVLMFETARQRRKK